MLSRAPIRTGHHTVAPAAGVEAGNALAGKEMGVGGWRRVAEGGGGMPREMCKGVGKGWAKQSKEWGMHVSAS